MKQKLKFIVISVISFIVLSGFTVPQRSNNSSVYDETNQVSREVATKLDNYNMQLAKSTTKPQIALLVLNTLNGETIETVANQTARAWKVGFSPTNNGAVIVIAIKDRKMRIETSDELATILSDYETNQILSMAKSDFRSGNYNAGIDKIIDELTFQMAKKMNITLSSTVKSKLSSKQEDNVGILVAGTAIMIGIVVMVVSSRNNRRYRQNNGLGDILTGMILGSMMNGRNRHRRNRRWDDDDDDDDFFDGFGSGNGSSSGGWSGGGFSGGGSSGSW